MTVAHELTGRVVWQGDSGYDEARQDYNERFSIYPRGIAFCQTVDDVIHAVRWARMNDVAVSVRSGRHSYEAFSLVEGGLVLDVSPIRRIEIDVERRRATVGAGIELLPLYETLWERGVTIPGGSCPTVGIAGLTLGGGFGLLSRLWGLTCDNLLELEMVSADGEVLLASESLNSDLFWASRGGGGGNFGVVTSFNFRVFDIDQVTIYNITWPWEDIRPVVDTWQSWAPGVDDRLVSILKLPAASKGTISSIGQFVGSFAELAAILEPLTAAGSPRAISIETVPYIEAVYRFAGIKMNLEHWMAHWHGPGKKFKNTSDYATEELVAQGIDTVVRFLETAPSSQNLIQFDNYGGAVNRVPKDATAFFHRQGTLYNMQYQAYWDLDSEENVNVAWVSEFRQAMQPFVSGAAYRNYCDSDIVDWPQAYYGGNFSKLVDVKRKYDPDNFFRYKQSIPTSVGTTNLTP